MQRPGKNFFDEEKAGEEKAEKNGRMKLPEDLW